MACYPDRASPPRAWPFTADDLALPAGLLHLPAEQVAAGALVELLDVQILDVEPQVGDAPGDAPVVSHHNARRARQGDPGDVQAGRLEMRHVPDARQPVFQVHIV